MAEESKQTLDGFLAAKGRAKGDKSEIYVGSKMEIALHAQLCDILGISHDTSGTATFKELVRKYVEVAGITL